MNMEDFGKLWDQADGEEDRAYEEWRQKDLEREQESEEALEECKSRGVSRKSLMVLARETGLTGWALKQGW